MKPTLDIIVVDDEITIREMNAMMIPMAFREYNARVHQAEDGIKFKALARSGDYTKAVVVSDINMPGCNGDEAVIELQREGKIGKALIITGKPTANNLRIITENNIPYLSKPYTMAEFLGKLKEVWPEYQTAPVNGVNGSAHMTLNQSSRFSDVLPHDYEFTI